MTTDDVPLEEHEGRIKARLRAMIGDQVFAAWFLSMHLEEGEEVGQAVFSVPNLFLQHWILEHYTDKLLAATNAEFPEVTRVKVNVRTLGQTRATPKIPPE